MKKALALAAKEAKALNHTYVGTEHILLGLLREGDGVAARVLKALRVDTDVARQNILRELDPNYSPPAEQAMTPQREDSQKLPGTIDITKRYDVYCREGEQQVVYRNVLFKGKKTLFEKHQYDILSDYFEIQQADGQTIFVARSSVIKFCEHGITPSSERV